VAATNERCAALVQEGIDADFEGVKMSEAWGTPDTNEQILWAFAHQDYAFVIDRAYERLSANQAQYVHVQLM
jgi:hypothetical protein